MKIISGGQTGTDRAALDVALSRGMDCGGWCPQGRRAEDGRIPPHYPLQELPGSSSPQRTRQNVIDSDATLILTMGPPDGGTALTVRLCESTRKPHLIIDGQCTSAADAAVALKDFIADEGVFTLNVAGPRESNQPGIGAYTRGVMEQWLDLEGDV